MMEFLRRHHREALLVVVSVGVSLAWIGGLWYLDTYSADLDGNVVYSYPIEGQDSPGFYELGLGIARGDGFTSPYGYPESFRSPGYPGLIALSERLGMGLVGVLVLQVLLTALVVVLTFWIGRALIGGVWWAALAALLTAFSPNIGFHTAIILSDLLFTALVVSAVYVFLFYSRPYRMALCVGLCIGAAVLVRPIALFLPLLFGVAHSFRAPSVRESLVVLCIAVAASAVVVLPWVVRNGIQTGVYTVSTVSSYNLARYNVPQYLAYEYGSESEELAAYEASLVGTAETSYSAPISETNGRVASLVLSHELVPYGIYHVLQTTKFFLSSSVRYVVIHLNVPELQAWFGITGSEDDLLSVLGSGDLSRINATLATQGIITFDRLVMVFVTVLLFIAFLFGYRRIEVLLLLALIAYFAILTGPVSIPRYRLPVEPFMWVLVVYAVNLLRLRHEEKS